MAGRGAAHLVLQIAELLTGPLPGRRGLLHLAVVEVLSRLLQVVSRLLKLLAGVGHGLLVLRLVHAVAQFVGITELLLLLLAQIRQLPLNFLPLIGCLGLLERALQLLHLAI